MLRGENSHIADAQAMYVNKHRTKALRHQKASSTVTNIINNSHAGNVSTIRHIPLMESGAMLPPYEAAASPRAAVTVNSHRIVRAKFRQKELRFVSAMEFFILPSVIHE